MSAVRETVPCSRLMLGTVQFGMPYGVANRSGQPGYEEVREIVSTALSGGVNCFDTAAAYGTSEEVMGRVLTELKVMDDVLVVTKVRALEAAELQDSQAAQRAIVESVEASRRKLRLECLPLVLFHREADAAFLDVLRDLQRRGWIREIGVSCDHAPQPALDFIHHGVDALQIPGNLLDPRQLRSEVPARAEQAGVKLFVRSAYLQGLLVMPETEIPESLSPAIPVRRRLAELASAAGLGMAELALRYVLSITGVTSVVVGVETVKQMSDNLELFDRGPLESSLLAAVTAAVPDLPEAVITPRLWNQ